MKTFYLIHATCWAAVEITANNGRARAALLMLALALPTHDLLEGGFDLATSETVQCTSLSFLRTWFNFSSALSAIALRCTLMRYSTCPLLRHLSEASNVLLRESIHSISNLKYDEKRGFYTILIIFVQGRAKRYGVAPHGLFLQMDPVAVRLKERLVETLKGRLFDFLQNKIYY